ncbi:MAG: STAS domain-containing protein [Rhodanobacter sp.]
MSQDSPSCAFEMASLARDTLGLNGVLSFATAAQAMHLLQTRLSTTPAVATLDLSGLAHADSAGLACLLALLGEASVGGRELRLAHVPEGLQVLARVCGVDQLLG